MRCQRSRWACTAGCLVALIFGLGYAFGAAAAPPPTDRGDRPISRVLRVNDVRIVGREQVALRQIRGILRRADLVAGAELLWPEDARVDRARDQLRATGLFKSVILRLEPVAGSRDHVVLVIELIERSTVSIDQLYLGTSRMTPFRGGAQVAERNFLGRGIRLGGAFIWGTLPKLERARRQQAYRLFAEAPRLGDAPLGVVAGAFFVSASEPYRVSGAEDDPDPRGFRAIDYTRVGGLLGLTFPIRNDIELGVDYRFERIDAPLPEAPTWIRPDGSGLRLDLGLRDSTHRLTSAHFGVHWDAREEVFLAGHGGRAALDLQLSSPALGSQYEYVKLVAAGAYSIRLPWRHWLTPQLSGGQIAGSAPVFEQFYAGDLTDWTPGREQGLRYSTRNPIDVFKTGIDKRTYAVLFGRVDLEYAVPLFRRMRTRVVYGGDLVVSLGIFTLVEDRATRARRRTEGDPVAPVGFNADFGLRLDTAVGTVNISIGNMLRRTPL